MSSYMGASDDFDAYINFDGADNYAPEENVSLSGPSHPYDGHRQQTGFAAGSITNVGYSNDISMSNDFIPSQPNFNSSYSGQMNPGYNSGLAFDGEFDASMQHQDNFFTSNNNDFSIDPSTVYETQPRPTRMYPGMHAQQAEQAKAANVAARQQEHHKIKMHHHAQPSASSFSGPLASIPSSSKGKQRAISHPMIDPVADRKISDILDSMRHKSNIATIDEEDEDSQAARNHKDEDDYDEDERLLASEEGKKLSSKERRQLRNKVSARAFRSRRKEYISQLEGDLNTKATEASDLRMINRRLLEENNQLKNLTRTVLSHPAFHNFLEDMSRNPTFVPPPAEMIAPASQSQAESTSSNAPVIKQELTQRQEEQITQPTHQYSSHQQIQGFIGQDEVQVNSMFMPQESLDMSMLNLGNNRWSQQQSTGFSNYQQPQVYAVFEVPRPSRSELDRSARTTSATPAHSSVVSAITTSREDFFPAGTNSGELNSVADCISRVNYLFDTLELPRSMPEVHC